MPWRGPAYEGEFPSLGWELAEWWKAKLTVPAGPLYGQPFELTDDQVQFFVRLYALRPDGSRVYRRGSRRGPKGKGKSPEGGLFVVAEFCGPVMFDGWDADGEPVARSREFPWVQVAAVSEEQDSNLYLPMREMLAESPLLDEEHIDLGKTRVEFRGRPGKIEPVSASAGSREGQPITAAVLEESHLWLPSKGGDRLAAAIRRNLGKTAGVSLEVTNAPALGERSVAESTLDAANRGQKGLLYDSVEAPFVDDPKNSENRDDVLAALREGYGDSLTENGGWVDLERQYEEITDESTTVADIYRFYFNLARKADNRAFDPKRFGELQAQGEVDGWCVLMFDGARTRDSAVLSGWTLGETPWHFHVESWERPPNADAGYEHPRGEIRRAVREFVAGHDVALFAFDSSFHELNSLYDEWIDEYGDLDPRKGEGLMVGYPTATGKRMEQAILRVLEDTREAAYRHDGNEVITRHVENAVLVTNRSGYRTLAKEKDSLRIDGAVTLTFGYDLLPMARDAAEKRKRTGTVAVEFV